MDKIAQAVQQNGVDIGESFGSPIGRDVTLGQLISNSITASIVGAGVVLLFFIIIAGFKMISSAGNHSPQEAAQGRQAVTAALAGFVVVFIAFWIIQLIEAVTGQSLITAPGF